MNNPHRISGVDFYVLSKFVEKPYKFLVVSHNEYSNLKSEFRKASR